MRTKRLLAVILTVCLAVSCCGTAFARATLHPLIYPDEAVSFEASADDHVIYYSFTPEAEGLYVLSDVAGGTDCRLSVHTVAPEDENFAAQLVTDGVGSISFTAQAGVTYWLAVDCSGAGTYSVQVSAAAVAQSLSIVGATLTGGEIGQTGAADLICLPYGSADEITWSSSDDTVVAVSGDANGVSYEFLAGGTATVTATTAGGLTASFEVTVTDPNALILGENRVVTIPANGGLYTESEQQFTFTPAVSGHYALAVSYDKSVDLWCGVQMSVTVGGEYLYSGSVLRFEAEAGQRYTIDVEFWGNYAQSVDHIFLLDVSKPAQAITLIPETSAGYVGDSLYVNVAWDPQTSRLEPLTWTSADPLIADVTYVDAEYAVLELYAPGTVTVNATTEGGLTHSVAITVYDPPGLLELTAGVAHPVMLLGYGNMELSFTPAETGYYRLSLNNEDLDAYLFQSGVYVGGVYVYYLTAGQTYGGGVDCYIADSCTGELMIELVDILSPTAMTVTKLPDTTVYLKEDLANLWTYEVLAGLKMEVTWSDGTVSPWSFDEEGPYLGDEELTWEIIDGETDDKKVLLLTCGDIQASCELTALDKMIESIRLVDQTPLVLFENSCGMAVEGGGWLYDSYSYYHRQLELTFSDGSVVLAKPDEQIYGLYVTCQDDQSEAPWVKGGDNRVTFGYGDFSVDLMVEIQESPVERLELTSPPVDTFLIGDSQFFTETSDGSFYFTPGNMEDFLAGLILVIWNKDGSSQTITDADIQWLDVAGEKYPFVDGYPLGIFSDLLMGMEPIAGPCEKEGFLEYKGASLTYPVHMVDELPPDPVEPTDPTDPTTEPSTEPTEPSTEPTDPTTEPSTEPTEPSTEPTEPSTEPTVPSTEPTEPSIEPTEPSTEATEPTTEPTEASTEPTTKPTEPSSGSTDASTESPSEDVPPTADMGNGLMTVLTMFTLMAVAIVVSHKKENI